MISNSFPRSSVQFAQIDPDPFIMNVGAFHRAIESLGIFIGCHQGDKLGSSGLLHLAAQLRKQGLGSPGVTDAFDHADPIQITIH